MTEILDCLSRSLSKINSLVKSINKLPRIYWAAVVCNEEALQVSGYLCKRDNPSTPLMDWSLMKSRADQVSDSPSGLCLF